MSQGRATFTMEFAQLRRKSPTHTLPDEQSLRNSIGNDRLNHTTSEDN
jgi:hypothetical protein